MSKITVHVRLEDMSSRVPVARAGHHSMDLPKQPPQRGDHGGNSAWSCLDQTIGEWWNKRWRDSRVMRDVSIFVIVSTPFFFVRESCKMVCIPSGGAFVTLYIHFNGTRSCFRFRVIYIIYMNIYILYWHSDRLNECRRFDVRDSGKKFQHV